MSGTVLGRGGRLANGGASRLAALLFPASIGLAWEVLARAMSADIGVFSPLAILRTGWDLLIDGTLLIAIATSWKTVGQGFLIAAALGVPLGMAAGHWPALGRWFHPIINVLRPIAPFAWIPMAILWFGASPAASVMISAYAAFFPIVTNAEAGVGRVLRAHVVAAQTLGASRRRIYSHVIVPSSAPLIFVGLRLGMGLAWAAVIAAELAIGKSSAAPAGIGYLMYLNFAIESDLNAIGSMMLAVGISALAVDWIIHRIQTAVIRWPADR